MRKLSFALAVILLAATYAPSVEQANLNSSDSFRDVSGTRIGHYKNGPLPVDLSGRTVAAYVPNQSGGHVTVPGSGTSGGTFTIPNVPTGFYLLQLGGTYLWTKNTVVDADFDREYRSNGVPANGNTTMTFDLTNLHKWQRTDVFEMVCPNNAAFNFLSGTVGETTFTGTFPYVGSLSDASQGDQYYASQFITQKVAGYSFAALGRHIAPAKFTQQQGSDTSINGRLKAIPQTGKFEANFNGADMAAQALAANPNAVLSSTGIDLQVYPGSIAKGFNTSTPDLIFGPMQPLITTNGDLGQVIYGNPFPPAKWPVILFYGDFAATVYVAPGATNGAPIGSGVLISTPTLPTSTIPMKPLVGVVTNPSINGKDFFANLLSIGATPLLKWSPPSLGQATYYLVQIYQLSNSGGTTMVSPPIASLSTQHASLRVPPGLLTTGSGYVFQIRAWYVPGLNFSKTPYMFGPTGASTDILSGMVQP
jgi:hypothetical protein